jgi:hypothetical protein
MNMTVYSCGGSRGIDRVPFLALMLLAPGNLKVARLRSAYAEVNQKPRALSFGC